MLSVTQADGSKMTGEVEVGHGHNPFFYARHAMRVWPGRLTSRVCKSNFPLPEEPNSSVSGVSYF